MRLFSVMLVAAALLTAQPVEAQTPSNCNSNLFDQAINRDKQQTKPGDIVNYSVAFANRPTLGNQIGCRVFNVTANFRCPGPDGQPTGPATNLVTDASYPPDGVVHNFGPFSCTMPDVTGSTIVLAGVFGSGLLDDGGPSPFLINKTISVIVSPDIIPPPPALVPTLSEWVFGLLASLILVGGMLTLRARRRSADERGDSH